MLPRRISSGLLLLSVGLLISCQAIHQPVEKVHFVPAQPRSISLNCAANEWIDFTVQIEPPLQNDAQNTRLNLSGLDRLNPDMRWYHPIQNFALAPLENTTDKAALSGIPSDGRIWIDLHIPAATPRGDYHGSCEITRNGIVQDQIPLVVHVYGFSIPSQPVTIAGEMTSADLKRLYGGNLPASLQPLISDCQKNQLQLWFTDLQPANRWPREIETWQPTMDTSEWQAAARVCAMRALLDKHSTVLCPGAGSGINDSRAWFCSANQPDGAPLETILLKKLRDSQQNAEYLVLARKTAAAALANQVANLLVTPVSGHVDLADQSLIAPADSAAFAQGKEFLARLIESRNNSTEAAQPLNLQLIRWLADYARPEMLLRQTDWTWDSKNPEQIDLKLSLDVYNPSSNAVTGSSLAWLPSTGSWSPRPPTPIPPLPPHRITPLVADRSLDATALHINSTDPSRLELISGFDGSQRLLNLSIPLASCDRRLGSPTIDGSLSDWSTDDTICNGPLVGSPTKPARAPSPTLLLANFSDTHLFLAFRVTTDLKNTSNSQFLIQPMYGDGSTGKIFAITCTATGVCQCSEGTAQYAATISGSIWRGELAIPWTSLGAKEPLPGSLRFNFLRKSPHGEITSWAGPINPADQPGTITGLLVLRNGPADLIK